MKVEWKTSIQLCDYSKVVGHPAYVFDLENRAIERLIDSEIIPHLQDYLAKPNNNSYLLLRIAMDQLATIDIHYKRKEYLFSRCWKSAA